jgi:lysophospholipase L1-like esterase
MAATMKAPNDPTISGGTLRVWVAADTEASIPQETADGADVATWADLSDNDNDFVYVGTEGEADPRDPVVRKADDDPPIFKKDQLNGKPGLKFTSRGANGSEMDLVDGFGGFTGDAYTLIVVGKNTTSPISFMSAQGGAGWYLQTRSQPAGDDMFDSNFSGIRISMDNFDDFFVFMQNMSPNTVGDSKLGGNQVWIGYDSTIFLSDTDGYPNAASTLVLGGRRPGQDQYGNCVICEIALFDGDLTLGDKWAVQNYMLDKYGFQTPDDGLILFEGNSTTEGSNTRMLSVDGLRTYPSQVCQQLAASGKYFRPYVVARGGDGAANVTARDSSLDAYQLSGFKNIACAFLGHNDLDGATGAAVEANTDTWCSNRQTGGWGGVVILTTTPRNEPAPDPVERTQLEPYTEYKNDYNVLVRANWSGYASAMVDIGNVALYPDLSTDTDSPGYSTPLFSTDLYYDQVHMNRDGATEIATPLTSAIEALLAPPTPDPATFATDPAATSTESISMTATTATDADGVEYYFTCTVGGGNDSGWQDGSTYEDTGLTTNTEYTYTVTYRDKSDLQNEGTASDAAAATTLAAPTPNPATFVTPPTALSTTSISMTATTAVHADAVEYFFTATNGGNDSLWQTSPTYIDVGLTPTTAYSYTVTYRETINDVEGTVSTAASATTLTPPSPSPEPDLPTLSIDTTTAFNSGVPNFTQATPMGDSFLFVTTNDDNQTSFVMVFGTGYTEIEVSEQFVSIGGFQLAVARIGSNYAPMAVVDTKTGTETTVNIMGNNLLAKLTEDGHVLAVTENSESGDPDNSYVLGGIALASTANRSMILVRKTGTVAETAIAMWGDTPIVVKRIGSNWYLSVYLTD